MDEHLKSKYRAMLGILDDQENKSPGNASAGEKKLSPRKETLKNRALEIMGVKKD